jgi:hypothetical protein
MSTSAEASPFDLAERRAARLAMVLEGYEVGDEGMPDSSVPGAARVEYEADLHTGSRDVVADLRKPRKPISHPRYVLLTQYGDKGNYRAYLANDLANVEQLARLAVCDGESIVVYFDLDELAGPEPLIYEGDVVRWAPGDVSYAYRVERVDEELVDGEVARYLCLVEQGREPKDWDDYDHRVDEIEVVVVERAEPDERMPVRYRLAKVVVSVVFNTVPSP